MSVLEMKNGFYIRFRMTPKCIQHQTVEQWHSRKTGNIGRNKINEDKKPFDYLIQDSILVHGFLYTLHLYSFSFATLKVFHNWATRNANCSKCVSKCKCVCVCVNSSEK